MTDFAEYKQKRENRIAEESQRSEAEFQRIESEIDSIDYLAAFRAAGICSEADDKTDSRLRDRYDRVQLDRLMKLGEDLSPVLNIPPEIAEELENCTLD